MHYTLTIGRGKENDIVINDSTVSKEHAILIIDKNGNLFIKDVGSTNGTYVNHQKISEKKMLQTTDDVLLGNFNFDWENVILTNKEETNQKNAQSKNDGNELVENEEKNITENKENKKKKSNLVFGVLAFFLAFGIFIWFYNNIDFTDGDDNNNQLAEGWALKSSEITYSIDCLRNTDFMSEMIGFGADLQDAFFEDENVEITIKDEEKVGDEVKNQLLDEYNFTTDSKYFGRIDKIAKKLTVLLEDTSKYSYEWYVMETDMINAFTVGGKIFFTTGIIDFAENDDELACVFGHEIYHNELGHIKKKLKKEKIAKDWLGDFLGEISYMATEIIGTSFNQESEAYCDMHGIDLVVKAGYNGCAAIGFWERMSAEEGEKDEFSKLLRSHPFSDERATCIHQHVELNYVESCYNK